MTNYAISIFYARTESKVNLDKVGAPLDGTFDGFVNRHSDNADTEFTSRWVYPEEEINRLIASLEAKGKTYIKILSCGFTGEYVSFRIFSQGRWDIEL